MERREVTRRIIADLRTRLLDLRSSNRLLNFRFSDRSRTHVRVIDELPDVLFRKLADDERITFEGLPEPKDTAEDEKSEEFRTALKAALRSDEQYRNEMEALGSEESTDKAQEIERRLRDRLRKTLGMSPRTTDRRSRPVEYAKELGWDPSFDLPHPSAEGTNKPNHEDKFIRTLLFPDQLQRKLAGIRDGARLSLQETGANTLYISFGFLEWFEDDSSDKKRLAPLLLHAIELKQELLHHIYRFSIESTGEETQVNLTLRERLRKDFQIELPEFGDEGSAEGYFEKVSEAVAGLKRWRVRRFVTVGIFSFGRLTMYLDLDPTRWPEEVSIDSHATVLDLLGGCESSDSLVAQEYEVDKQEIESQVPILISEADSSQFSALVDVAAGRNLAIKGPPGSGKSQTITNIIALALWQEKKVLFVAEKMAALEVVKSRLDAAGLGEFCLELHSTKARKRETLEALRSRLELRCVSQSRDFAETLREYQEHREKLSAYVKRLNSPVGETGKTLQEIIWSTNRARDRAVTLGILTELKNLQLSAASKWSAPEAGSRRGSLKAFETQARRILDRHESLDEHPWACLGLQVRSPFEVDDALQYLKDWSECLRRLQRVVVDANSEMQTDFPETVSGAEEFWRCLELVPSEGELPAPEILSRLARADSLQSVERYLVTASEYTTERQAVGEFFGDSEAVLPSSATLHSLHTCWQKHLDDKTHEKMTVSDLKANAVKYAHLARRAKEVNGIVGRVLQCCGYEQAVQIRELGAIVHAARILKGTEGGVLERRADSLLQASARDTLERFEKDAVELRRDEASLRERFVFSVREEPEIYAYHARVMRLAGPLARLFGREHRLAKRAWRLVQNRARRASPFVMASELEEISEHIGKRVALTENEELRSICGERFAGIATDFALLRRVSEYGCVVRDLFRGNDGICAVLCEVLLKGAVRKVTELQEIVGDCGEGLKSFVDELMAEDSAWGDANVSEVNANLEGVSSIMRSLVEQCDSAGLQGDVELGRLPEVVTRLDLLERLQTELDSGSEARAVLGEFRPDCDGEFGILAKATALCRQLRETQVRESFRNAVLSSEARERLTAAPRIRRELGEALGALETSRKQVIEAGSIDFDLGGEASAEDVTLEGVAERIENLISDSEGRGEWLEVCRLRQQVEEAGVGDLLQAAWGCRELLLNLGACFDFVYHHTILREVFERDGELAAVSGIRMNEIRRRFQELDRKILSLSRAKLTEALFHRALPKSVGVGPKSGWTGLPLIRNELGKRKRHLPLRDLIARAGDTIAALKPCWLMSPASVAQFVSPGAQQFDLVVIDEASQMKPEQALGAIARATQVVVVGDPKQLPPTDFFERSVTVDEDQGDTEDYVDSESILDLALGAFQPNRDLRWHYRSRHESLIAFSNKHFYENRLLIFPSACAKRPDLGVELQHVEQGCYAAGGINLPELRAVRDAAVEFMKTNPNKSLGVVTLNLVQAELLQEEMDLVFQNDSLAEDYRSEWEASLEPFFVKNLERVQGDERDVIFVSLVYGPNETGRVLQRFGPVNSAVGHRRLNVLFTRAKERIVVFSSMRSSDVKPVPTSREGVWVLKRYLEYAESGRLEVAAPSGREPDSDFEVAVADRLRMYGFDVVGQVGVSGFYVDLAVKSPSNSDTYLCGIECDGATYHSSKSARDRDRLRQEVLEQLGWRLYRIWSTDWFADPGGETQKLVRHLSSLSEAEALHATNIDHEEAGDRDPVGVC